MGHLLVVTFGAATNGLDELASRATWLKRHAEKSHQTKRHGENARKAQ